MKEYNKSGAIDLFYLGPHRSLAVANSPFTGNRHSVVIDADLSSIEAYYGDSRNIQDSLPNLPAYQREFLMTSIPDEEYPNGEDA